MNGLNQVGVVREGVQRRRLVGPQEHGHIVLVCIPRWEMEPRERVFEVAPDAFNGVQLGTVRGQEHQADVCREDEPLGGMRATVVQEQEIQAIREGLCKGVDEELKALGVQVRQLQEEASTRRGFHGSIDGEPLKDVLHRADGLHPPGRETAAADGQQAEAAFVLAEDTDGASIDGWDRLLQVATTARLEGWNRVRIFLCGSAEPL
jgi:hypothetical protein